MSEYDDLLDDELTEGAAVGELADSGSAAKHSEEEEAIPVVVPPRPERAAPSVSIIKTPENVPAALDRIKADREWLARRVGKKK